MLRQIPAVLVLVLVAIALSGGGGAAPELAILPLVAGLVGRKAIGKAGAWLGRAVGRTVRGAARNPTTTGIIVGAATGGLTRGTNPNGAIGGGNPFAPQGGGAPRPREGIVGRTISRIIPGGNTGREWMPFEGTENDKYGRPIAVYPDSKEVAVAPRGYVIVRDDDGNALAMLRNAAIAMGLWKAPPKPPVSGWDARAIRRATSATKRVKKLAQKVGFTVAKKGRG